MRSCANAVCALGLGLFAGEKFPRAMRSLGRTLLREGDPEGCVECLKKATAINPLQVFVCVVCVSCACVPGCVRCVCVRVCMSAWVGMRSLGRTLLREGDPEGCVECLRKATTFNPLQVG